MKNSLSHAFTSPHLPPLSRTSVKVGFQGQLQDDEVKGEGNSVNFEYRMHDPRLGRFFAVDPLTSKYPWYTPYSFSGNKLVAWKELEGCEEIYYQNQKVKGDENHAALRLLRESETYQKHIDDFQNKEKNPGYDMAIVEENTFLQSGLGLAEGRIQIFEPDVLSTGLKNVYPNIAEVSDEIINSSEENKRGLVVVVLRVGTSKNTTSSADKNDFKPACVEAELIAHEFIAHVYESIFGKKSSTNEQHKLYTGKYGLDSPNEVDQLEKYPSAKASKVLKELKRGINKVKNEYIKTNSTKKLD